MGVFEDGASDAGVTDEGADAGEADVEAVGLGKLRGEEAELNFADGAGVGGESDSEDGSGGRVRLQIEVEEAEPEAAVVAGKGGTDGARMSAFRRRGRGRR